MNEENKKNEEIKKTIVGSEDSLPDDSQSTSPPVYTREDLKLVELKSDIKSRILVKKTLRWCIIGLIVSYSVFILSYLGGIVANTFWKCNFDLDMMRREISVVIAFGFGFCGF